MLLLLNHFSCHGKTFEIKTLGHTPSPLPYMFGTSGMQ